MMDLSKIQQVKDWSTDHGEFDVRAFALSEVTVAEASAVSMLCWPEFVEFRDCVFLKILFDEAGVDAWFEQTSGDRKAVEGVVNHLHLWDVFGPTSDEEYRALSQLAIRMKDMWKAALGSAFPEKKFLVSLSDEPGDYGPTLSFQSA